jgi:hypothetical protein
MKIVDTDFNQEWAKTVTKKEFVNHLSTVLYQDLTPKEREEKLSSAWDLLNDKLKKGEQPVSNEGGAE